MVSVLLGHLLVDRLMSCHIKITFFFFPVTLKFNTKYKEWELS